MPENLSPVRLQPILNPISLQGVVLEVGERLKL